MSMKVRVFQEGGVELWGVIHNLRHKDFSYAERSCVFIAEVEYSPHDLVWCFNRETKEFKVWNAYGHEIQIAHSLLEECRKKTMNKWLEWRQERTREAFLREYRSLSESVS